ncbi:MAG: hypothetical protein JWN67_4064, partial [Actinomycetia bacterium]|nr:hypothetical protein [Actinomycetes bacterium]
APLVVRFADVQRFVVAHRAARMSAAVRGGSTVEATVDGPATVRVVEDLGDHVVETVVDGGSVHRRQAGDDAALSERNWHEVPAAIPLLAGDSALAHIGGPTGLWSVIAGLRGAVRTGPLTFRATSADGRGVTLRVGSDGAPRQLSIGGSEVIVRDWGDTFAIEVPGRDVDLTPMVDEPALDAFRLGPVQVPDLPGGWEAVRSAIGTYDDEEGCDSATVTYTLYGAEPWTTADELLASLVEPGCEDYDYDYDIGLARSVRWGHREVRVMDHVPGFSTYTEENGIAVWVPTEHGTVVLSTFADEPTMERLVASLHPLVPMPVSQSTS